MGRLRNERSNGGQKGLNWIRKKVLKWKVTLFWVVVVVVAFTLVVYLWWGHGRPCDYQLWISGTWALLSLGIGAMIFFQLEDYKEVENHEDLIKLVTNKIKSREENDIVVITPNLNLGQTTMPSKFEEYKGAVLKKKAGKIYFYLICKDDKYDYDRFDMNAYQYLNQIPEGSKIDHLDYVLKLFKNMSISNSNKPHNILIQYNQFIQKLKESDTIEVRPIKSPFQQGPSDGTDKEIDKDIFMIYDSNQLLAYKVNNTGILGEIVKTEHQQICKLLMGFHTLRDNPGIDQENSIKKSEKALSQGARRGKKGGK